MADRSLSARFWAKVARNAPDRCWPWKAQRSTTGYGRFKLKGRPLLAHRMAWEIAHGPVPAGLCVCHTCDVRHCVNPAHLWLGTAADNNADMKAKGRGRGPLSENRRGERNPNVKLTTADVIAIREVDGLHRDIARRYGVSRALVSMIRSRELWGHLS